MSASNFTNAADVRRFLLGGRAVLSLRSHKSGEHRTYRVSRKDESSPYFVALLTGPDNTEDYTYLGVMDKYDNRLIQTRASRLPADSIPVRAWNYLASHLGRDALPRDADVMHEGKCGCCGRALTVPESIATGFGPECSAKMGIPRAELPVEPVLPVKEPPLLIRVTYSSIDGGGCKTMKFKTLKGAQSFAQKWVGVGPELGYGYAVSGDGVGKITCEGVPVAALFPLLQGV